ncbi:MAG: HepT-like ribonuclease domain-containing protein [Methanothrix sp.]
MSPDTMEAMTGMRNKLVHHYFGVDWEIVEDVILN